MMTLLTHEKGSRSHSEIIQRIDALVEEIEGEGVPFDVITQAMEDYSEMMNYHNEQM